LTLDRRPAQQRPLIALIQWAIVLCVIVASVFLGFRARVWQFNVTEPVHFYSDVTRNWLWGSYTWHNIHDKGRSFFDTYDDLGIQSRERNPYTDYAPLRMAVFTMWAASDEKAYPDRHYRFPNNKTPTTRDFHAFYVDFNAAMELVGAIGAFMLTRYIVRRSRFAADEAEPFWTTTGVGAGLAAALILWFNPAMWLSAHSWPGGDSWIIPPFLWAVYFCASGRWFVGGAVLGLGALFKGQQFIVAPMFLLWPLFQLRPTRALRFIAGVLALFGLATTPWTLTHVDAMTIRHVDWLAVSFVTCGVTLIVALPLLLKSLGRKWDPENGVRPSLRLLLALPCVLALFWPLLLHVERTNGTQLYLSKDAISVLLFILVLTVTLVAAFIRPRNILIAAAGVAGASALLSMPLFNTCFAWFDAGYLFGTNHWEVMIMGKTSNLPGLMERRFGWHGDNVINQVQATWHLFGLTIELTLRKIFFWIYATLLVLASAGIAMQHRRRSRRFLVAICTPWLLFFCFPAQIHERYLLFGAAVAAVCAGYGVGMALLGIFLSAVTWIMTMNVLLDDPWRERAWNGFLANMYPNLFARDTRFSQELQKFLTGTHPDIGWAVLLATGVFFYITVTPLWIRRRRPVQSGVLEVEPIELPLVEPRPSALPQADRPLPALEPIPLE